MGDFLYIRNGWGKADVFLDGVKAGVGIDVSMDAAIISEAISPHDNHSPLDTTSFTFTFHIRRHNPIILMQAFGFLKKPKTTYKTTRRGCAKKNK